MKKLLYILLSAGFLGLAPLAHAITLSATTVSSLSDWENISVTSFSNTLGWIVDPTTDKGVCGQAWGGAAPINLDTNPSNGWNTSVTGNVDAHLCPAGTDGSGGENFPSVGPGFDLKIYDVNSGPCINNWSNSNIACVGQPFAEVTYLAPPTPRAPNGILSLWEGDKLLAEMAAVLLMIFLIVRLIISLFFRPLNDIIKI